MTHHLRVQVSNFEHLGIILQPMRVKYFCHSAGHTIEEHNWYCFKDLETFPISEPPCKCNTC